MRPVPPRATEFVAAEEALRLESYQDPAGVWTIGYGHTGPAVHGGQRISEAQADRYLAEDLGTARARLYSVAKPEVIEALSEGQYVALLSFVFNVGVNAKWDIWRVLNRRQLDAVPAELMRFVNAGGKKLKGLVNRRTAEVALWNEDAEDLSAPSGFTRAEQTPPTPFGMKPLFLSKRFIATGGAAVLGAPKLIDEASQKLTPYAGKSHLVQQALETLATLGAGAAICAAVFVWWAHKVEAKQ